MYLRQFYLLLFGVLLVTPCAYSQVPPSSQVGAWNGFNNHLGVIECLYSGESVGTFNVTAWRSSGDLLNSQDFFVGAGGGSTHILLNEFYDATNRGVTDDHGLFSIQATGSSKLDRLKCLSVIYKYGQDNRMEYSFAMPVEYPRSEVTSGLFNSIDPSGIGGETHNWLSVMNPSETEVFVYTLSISSNGITSTQEFAIAPRGKNDHPMHGLDSETGMYRITPLSGTYISSLSRYLSHSPGSHVFGFRAASSPGTSSAIIPVSTMARADNWIALGNPLDVDIEVKFVMTSGDGTIVYEDDNFVRVPAGGQRDHLYVNAFLDPQGTGQVGSLSIRTKSLDQKFILESGFYGKGPAGKLRWAYVDTVQPSRPLGEGETLNASINTFIGAANWYKASNARSIGGEHGFLVRKASGELEDERRIFLPARGSIDLPIHEYLEANQVGTAQIVVGTDVAEISGQLLRVYFEEGEISYIMPTPLFRSLRSGSDGGPLGFEDEFSGNAFSLAPYRDTLTDSEIRHFLTKVGFGWDGDLFRMARDFGLSYTVDALLDQAISPEVEQQARAHQASYRNASVGKYFEVFDTSGNSLGSQRHETGKIFPTFDALRDYWLTHMVEGNPLNEKVALVLHNHFAVNQQVVSSSYSQSSFMEEYLQLLRTHSRGNFFVLLEEMTQNPAMLKWLDGETNKHYAINENYGREFLELFAIGENNLITGEENYTYEDVLSFSADFAGLKISKRKKPYSFTWTDPNTSTQYTREADLDEYFSEFDPSHWKANPEDPEKVWHFRGEDYSAYAGFDYRQASAYIFQHEHASIYIGGTLFQTLVHPEPADETLERLGVIARTGEGGLKPVLRKILKSEAMFSDFSRNVCVKAPIEMYVQFIKSANIPLLIRRKDNSTSYHYDLYKAVLDSSALSGQRLLAPPSVFGWVGTCGVNRESVSRGSNWLAGADLLTRENRVWDILKELEKAYKLGDFKWSDLLPQADATPEETVDFLVFNFGLEYTDEQRDALVEYMSHAKLSTSGAPVPYEWDNNAEEFEDFLSLKLPGLLKIFAEDYRFQIM